MLMAPSVPGSALNTTMIVCCGSLVGDLIEKKQMVKSFLQTSLSQSWFAMRYTEEVIVSRWGKSPPKISVIILLSLLYGPGQVDVSCPSLPPPPPIYRATRRRWTLLRRPQIMMILWVPRQAPLFARHLGMWRRRERAASLLESWCEQTLCFIAQTSQLGCHCQVSAANMWDPNEACLKP